MNFSVAAGHILSYVLAGVLSLLFPSVGFGDEPQKKVLIFNSEDVNVPANSILVPAIRSALKSGPPPRVEIFSESLDNFRIPNEKYETDLVGLLQRKYQGVNIDLIIPLGHPALQFVLKYRAKLFPGSPVVFGVHEENRVAGMSLGSNITGVWGRIELSPTLDIALTLHPGADRVAVVASRSSIGKYMAAQAQREFAPYQEKVRFTYLTDLTFEELRQALASLPKKSIILFLTFTVDREGKNLPPSELLPLLAPSANAPIYVVSQIPFGYGVVGGRLLSYDAIGARTGEVALKVLAGQRPDDITSRPVASVTMFDWRQLKRWGVSEDRLPQGSILLFKEPSFWELYRWRIVAAVALLVAQTLLIAGLLVQWSRSARAEKSRRASEENLRKLSGRLLYLQDEERRRIAAELHDGLGQSLAIINNRALIGLRDAADSDRVTEQFEEISFAASSAIDEVREIAHNLRPHELDKLGLIQAVKSMVAKVSDSSAIRFSSDLDEFDGLLPLEAETSIYRIVQEGLNNIVKHADATEALVSVKRIGNELVITVSDNGKGIPKPMTNGELGTDADSGWSESPNGRECLVGPVWSTQLRVEARPSL